MSTPASEQSVFLHAIGLGSAAERGAYLDDVCRDNPGLRAELDALLAAHDRLGGREPGATASFAAGDVPATSARTVELGSGTVLAGRYKLVERIGEGGMGEVWMAQQTEPVKRMVAVKLIKPGMDSRTVLVRFEAERQALALMDHPNIATVLDGGTTPEGQPYFVMELVKGVPITTFCDDRRLTPRERLALFVPVCQAVQHAHQKGVIHRDIKPSNVLVALYDDRPVPKVIDFGVAKATGPALTDRTLHTGFGAVVGTLEYMSPEQAGFNQLDADTRSDVYSLGVLLYELLAGSPPFARKELEKAGVLEMLRVIREQEPSRPSAKLSTSDGLPSLAASRGTEPARLTKLVRGELDWIVMKCLEKDRGRRYETANAFAADLQRYLADEPVLACPPSPAYRFRKFARRNTRALATAAVVGVVLLAAVGAVAGAYGWAARDRAGRIAAADLRATLALDEAGRHRDQRRWEAALAAVARADSLLAGGGSEELRRGAGELRRDLEMVIRLERIRDEVMSGFGYEGETKHDVTRADAEYRRAFADFGIAIDELPFHEAAHRLGSRGAATEFAAALDSWALARSLSGSDHWKSLLALAKAVDPDDTRCRLRDAWERRDRTALQTMAASEPVLRQPAHTLYLLGVALREVGNLDGGIAFLRKAQQRHPDDFWINIQLVHYYAWEVKPSPRAEVNRYAAAANAVRKQSAAPYRYLANQLLTAGKLDEAVAANREAVRLKPDYWAAHYNLGVALKRQGQRDEAIAAHREAARLMPTWSWPHAALASALSEKGDTAGAEAAIREALRLGPDEASVHHGVGVALANLKRLDEAIVHFRRAVELDSKDAKMHCDLGTSLLNQEKLDEAVGCFEKAIELDPKNAKAHLNLGRAKDRQGKKDEALACFKRTIELDPKDSRVHIGLGNLVLDRGKVSEAIECYRRAAELDPRSGAPHLGLGNAYRGQGRPEEALAAYRKAIGIDPGYAAAHNGIGNVLHDQGKLSDAIAAYRSAIGLDPKHAIAHNNLGNALADQGKVGEAIRCYRAAIKLDPRLAMAHSNLGNALLGQGKVADAVECYRTAIGLDANYSFALSGLGNALKAQGDTGGAIACYRKAIGLDSKNRWAYANLGAVLQAQGEMDEARACYQKVIELQPGDGDAWARRHQVYVSLKQYDQALAEYSRAIERNPADPLAWQYRHGLYQELKQFDKAVVVYSEAIKLKPGDTLAIHYRAAAYRGLEQSDKALDDYSKIIDLKPDDAQGWNVRGSLYEHLKQNDRAISDYSKAIQLKPNYWSALANRSRVYANLKLWDKAIADKTSMLRLQPKKSGNELAWLLATCPDKKFRNPARAVELAKAAVELQPKYGPWWNTLGVAQYRAGDWNACLAALHKSMELREGGDSFDWFFLAMAHWQLNDRPEARRRYDKAVEWMDKNKLDDEELRQFRAEAEKLMGIERPEVAPLPRPKP